MSHTRALTDALEHLRQKEDALSEAMGEVERRAAQMKEQRTEDVADWLKERETIARILETFYRSPLSMSSVAPVLELAEAMNPHLAVLRFGLPIPDAWKPFAKKP